MLGNTAAWFRCAPCSDSVDNEEFLFLLEGPGGWPPKLRGACWRCFREYEATHLHRTTDLSLPEPEAQTAELGYCIVRSGGEIVGVVCDI